MWTACQDFVAVNLDATTAINSPVVKRSASTPVYFLLQNQPDADGVQVAKVLHELRENGARNYGLRYGEFLNTPASLRHVAMELAAHSIRGMRN